MTERPMVSIRSELKGRAAKLSPELRRWREDKQSCIRDYFAGDRTIAQLRQDVSGYSGFRLVSMTDPDTEEWSLLMSALDVLIDSSGVPPLKKLSHGYITVDEYLKSLERPAPGITKHGW
jgi:hypothetical protein